MALEGTIRDFGLPDIFQLIGLQRKTGVLTLNNGQESVTVTFENGMVVSADSSGKRLEDRLGGVLVKQGKLRRERLEEALQTQKATLQRLGHILVTQSHITSTDLREALHVQVSQLVFKLFRWREGDYHFDPTDAVDYDRDNFAPMSADFILMEGIRMVDEWPIIEKRIPSFDLVFRSAVDPASIEVASGEEPEGDAPRGTASNRMRLTPQEERIYRRVDGARTVQAIIDGTGLGEFEVCRTLFDLLNRSIIAPVGRGQAREAAVGAGEEARPSSLPGHLLTAAALLAAALSVLSNLGRPFAVTGLRPLLEPAYGALLGSVGHDRLERIDRGVLAFNALAGRLPDSLTEVVQAGLLDAADLKDPWGRPCRYARTARGYRLSADAPEGGRAKRDIERVLGSERP